MPDAARLRDSTQLSVPTAVLDGADHRLESRFDVTVARRDGVARVIGSPVAIERVSDHLVRRGVLVR